MGLLICMKPLLSTFLTRLDAHLFQLRPRLVFKLERVFGLFLLTSSAAAWNPLLLLFGQADEALSLMNSAALLASCSVRESTGAGS